MMMILAVAAGGAIGAVLRYLAGIFAGRFIDSGLWATLGVNVIGSFLLGLFVMYFTLVSAPSQELRTFLTVGLLGAFTTFSTFSLDVVTLWSLGNYNLAIIYLASSVILSVLALSAGMMIIRTTIS